jgi:hypothetical protein
MDKLPPPYARHAALMADKELSKPGMDWLLSLDKEHFPIELAKYHPRIINILAEHWNSPVEGRAYLDGLLLDDRGGREGFSMSVLRELIALKELHNKVVPQVADIWDKAHLIRPEKL